VQRAMRPELSEIIGTDGEPTHRAPSVRRLERGAAPPKRRSVLVLSTWPSPPPRLGRLFDAAVLRALDPDEGGSGGWTAWMATEPSHRRLDAGPRRRLVPKVGNQKVEPSGLSLAGGETFSATDEPPAPTVPPGGRRRPGGHRRGRVSPPWPRRGRGRHRRPSR
jgi:hypothetical protein